MNIYRLDEENASLVAKLMNRMKPEWWPSEEDAYGQLTNIDETIKTVGWYMGEDAKAPKGMDFVPGTGGLPCFRAGVQRI